MGEEEARAIEYRRRMQAREDFRLAEEKRLAGSTVDADRIRRNFEPLRRWGGWEPKRRVKGEPE